MNLAWKTAKNSVYAVAEYAWPIALALFTAPFIVNHLGASGYGLLSIVGVTLGFFGFLDLGIGAAATRQVAAYYDREQHEKIGIVLSTAVAFYLLVGVAGSLLILALTDTLVSDVLKIPPEQTATAKTAFYVSALALPVSLVVSAFTAVPRAIQRFDVSTKISFVFATTSSVAVVVLLALGKGIVAILVAGLLMGLVGLLVGFLVIRRLLPTVRIRISIDPHMLRELLSFGGYFFLSTIGALLLYQLDKFLIGAFLGVVAVTYYVVPGNLAQRIQGLAAAAVAVVFPVSASLFAAAEREALQRLYTEGSRLVLILIVSIAVPLAVFAERFLAHWMGPEIASGSATTMMILVATYALLSTTGMAWSIANGLGRARINAAFTFAIFIVDVGLFLLLIGHYGVPGAAAAYLASAIVGVPALIACVERKLLELSGIEFLRVSWRVGVTGVLQLLIGLALRPLAVNLWSVLALMVFVFALFFPLYWGLGFAREGDRLLLSLFVRRVRG